jgi:dipeptidase
MILTSLRWLRQPFAGAVPGRFLRRNFLAGCVLGKQYDKNQTYWHFHIAKNLAYQNYRLKFNFIEKTNSSLYATKSRKVQKNAKVMVSNHQAR